MPIASIQDIQDFLSIEGGKTPKSKMDENHQLILLRHYLSNVSFRDSSDGNFWHDFLLYNHDDSLVDAFLFKLMKLGSSDEDSSISVLALTVLRDLLEFRLSLSSSYKQSLFGKHIPSFATQILQYFSKDEQNQQKEIMTQIVRLLIPPLCPREECRFSSMKEDILIPLSFSDSMTCAMLLKDSVLSNYHSIMSNSSKDENKQDDEITRLIKAETSTLSLLHDWESVMESILNNSIEDHEEVKLRQIWIELLRISKSSMLGRVAGFWSNEDIQQWELDCFGTTSSTTLTTKKEDNVQVQRGAPETETADKPSPSSFYAHLTSKAPIHISTVEEMERKLGEIHVILSKTQDADLWQTRQEALVDIERIVASNCLSVGVDNANTDLRQNFITALKNMPISEQIMDLRSQITKQACRTLISLAWELRNHSSSDGVYSEFSVLLEHWIDPLFCLCKSGVKLMAQQGTHCLFMIFAFSGQGYRNHSSRILNSLFQNILGDIGASDVSGVGGTKAASTSKNKGKNATIHSNIKKSACLSLSIVLKYWSWNVLEKYSQEIKKSVLEAITDRDPQVREQGRYCYWALSSRISSSNRKLAKVVQDVRANLDMRSQNNLDKVEEESRAIWERINTLQVTGIDPGPPKQSKKKPSSSSSNSVSSARSGSTLGSVRSQMMKKHKSSMSMRKLASKKKQPDIMVVVAAKPKRTTPSVPATVTAEPEVAKKTSASNSSSSVKTINSSKTTSSSSTASSSAAARSLANRSSSQHRERTSQLQKPSASSLGTSMRSLGAEKTPSRHSSTAAGRRRPSNIRTMTSPPTTSAAIDISSSGRSVTSNKSRTRSHSSPLLSGTSTHKTPGSTKTSRTSRHTFPTSRITSPPSHNSQIGTGITSPVNNTNTMLFTFDYYRKLVSENSSWLSREKAFLQLHDSLVCGTIDMNSFLQRLNLSKFIQTYREYGALGADSGNKRVSKASLTSMKPLFGNDEFVNGMLENTSSLSSNISVSSSSRKVNTTSRNVKSNKHLQVFFKMLFHQMPEGKPFAPLSEECWIILQQSLEEICQSSCSKAADDSLCVQRHLIHFNLLDMVHQRFQPQIHNGKDLLVLGDASIQLALEKVLILLTPAANLNEESGLTLIQKCGQILISARKYAATSSTSSQKMNSMNSRIKMENVRWLILKVVIRLKKMLFREDSFGFLLGKFASSIKTAILKVADEYQGEWVEALKQTPRNNVKQKNKKEQQQQQDKSCMNGEEESELEDVASSMMKVRQPNFLNSTDVEAPTDVAKDYTDTIIPHADSCDDASNFSELITPKVSSSNTNSIIEPAINLLSNNSSEEEEQLTPLVSSKSEISPDISSSKSPSQKNDSHEDHINDSRLKLASHFNFSQVQIEEETNEEQEEQGQVDSRDDESLENCATQHAQEANILTVDESSDETNHEVEIRETMSPRRHELEILRSLSKMSVIDIDTEGEEEVSVSPVKKLLVDHKREEEPIVVMSIQHQRQPHQPSIGTIVKKRLEEIVKTPSQDLLEDSSSVSLTTVGLQSTSNNINDVTTENSPVVEVSSIKSTHSILRDTPNTRSHSKNHVTFAPTMDQQKHSESETRDEAPPSPPSSFTADRIVSSQSPSLMMKKEVHPETPQQNTDPVVRYMVQPNEIKDDDDAIPTTVGTTRKSLSDIVASLRELKSEVTPGNDDEDTENIIENKHNMEIKTLVQRAKENSSDDNWEKHFGPILNILMEYLSSFSPSSPSSDSDKNNTIIIVYLQTIRALLRYQSKHFDLFVEVVMDKLLECAHTNYQNDKVVHSVEKALENLVKSQDSTRCLRCLSPYLVGKSGLTAGNEDSQTKQAPTSPSNKSKSPESVLLLISFRSLQKFMDRIPQPLLQDAIRTSATSSSSSSSVSERSETRRHHFDLVLTLKEAMNHSSVDMRKAAVFNLVELYFALVGTNDSDADDILNDLSSAQQKLMNIYIQRHPKYKDTK